MSESVTLHVIDNCLEHFTNSLLEKKNMCQYINTPKKVTCHYYNYDSLFGAKTLIEMTTLGYRLRPLQCF